MSYGLVWSKEPVGLAATPIICATPTLCEKSEQKRNTIVANASDMHRMAWGSSA